MNRERNNLKAGLFVTIGMALMIVVVLVLSDIDRWSVTTDQWIVRFNLADGLQGLKVGSQVTIGDQEAGVVVLIDDVVGDDGVITHKDVHFTVPSGYKVYENAIIELSVPPLGSGTRLNVKSFGVDRPKADGFSGDSWLWEAGDPPIVGGLAGSVLTANLVEDMGIGEQQREELRAIIRNVKSITDVLATDMPKITTDVSSFVGDVRKRSSTWFDRLDNITDNAAKALATTQKVLDDIGPKLSSASNTLDKLLTDAQPKFTSVLAKGDSTLGDAQVVMKHIRENSLKDIDAVGDNLAEATGNIKLLVASQTPVLERTFANLRLVSDQLKLAAIEVRRSPWRLLYDPSDRELETDNLYDAARSFSLAAGSLDTTIESLRTVVERHGNLVNADKETLNKMLQSLNDSFKEFQGTQKQFYELLNKAHEGE